MRFDIDLWQGKDMGEFRPFLQGFLLDTPKPLGAVIIAPGGGYLLRSRGEAEVVAECFNKLGFHAFVLEYRVNTPFPASLQDALRAVKIIRLHSARWHVAPGQIALGGFSAGGHLAASAGVYYDEIPASAGDDADRFSGRPDALLLCYPAIDVDPKRSGHGGTGRVLAGTDEPSQEQMDQLSMQLHVKANAPPAFLWHTADDSVKVENSLAFARSVWAKGGTAELHIFAGGPHGLGLAEKYENIKVWPRLAAQFLKTVCHFSEA